MAYIGHSASGNFTTKPSKDTFSGDGSTTAFTLSEGATTNTVDVFVENVRQEPTTAYTVDGTTLTFTAAPGSGTNNIYVVNRGPLQLSATHPAAQALEASTGTFTGDLTVDTNTLVVDSTNNRVGVGNISPAKELDVTGAIRASTGMLFGSDTAAANTLDDYEEGTFTPSINGVTHTTTDGHYVKVGNLITCKGIITNATTTGSSSNALLEGLPYSVAADVLPGTILEGSGFFYYWNNITVTASAIYVVPRAGSTQASLYYIPSAGVTSGTEISILDTVALDSSSVSIRFALSYFTD